MRELALAEADGPAHGRPSDTTACRQATLTLVVAILTYRRVEQLEQNLPAVNSEVAALSTGEPAPVSATVLVVDNDPEQSARTLVERSFPQVRYVCEPEPGISAARNRALTESRTADLLVFIDDDERPRADWLTHLVHTWRSSGAAAVPGRVVPRYDAEPDPWLLAGRFFDRPERVTGTRMRSVAAGNLLLDLGQLRHSGLTFEEPFGATGGEDSLLGRRLVQAGHEIVWCAESVVEDRVPTERLTRTWVLQRAFSQGNLQALIDCHLADGWASAATTRARRALAGVFYITRGAGRSASGYLVSSRARQADGLRILCRGLGMVAGVTGHAYEQYARPRRADRGGN